MAIGLFINPTRVANTGQDKRKFEIIDNEKNQIRKYKLIFEYTNFVIKKMS